MRRRLRLRRLNQPVEATRCRGSVAFRWQALYRPTSTTTIASVDVETKMTLALALVGFGAVATGALGIVLPPGERIAAGLALVVGAGIGVVAIAIGTRVAGEADSSYANVVLVASALGLAGTLTSLGLLWRRTAAERAARTSAPREG